MATITAVVDDLSGETIAESDAETVRFVVDGITYEMDLGPASGEAFRDAFAPFIEKARRIETPTRVSSQRSSSASEREDGMVPATVRAWALAHPRLIPAGVTVNERGRLPEAVYEAYAKAHN